ncbi:hypothetical protein NHQ30_002096 [Ciborinia camelliae]|nr:hypothetical protein NHQ30_002096 [Ciborinia camelliae]
MTGSNTPVPNKKKKKDDCIKTFELRGGNPRSQKIAPAYQGTFAWIWEEVPGFLTWLRDGTSNGCYCIQGKPGSGKSTVMKYLCDHFSSGIKLLGIFPDLSLTVLPILEQATRQAGAEYFTWEEATLKAALIEIIRNWNFEATVYIFIDGLDECGETEIARRESLHFLKGRVEEASKELLTLRLCLSSPPQNAINALLFESSGLIVQKYTKHDILNYAKTELQKLSNREQHHFGPVQDRLVNSIANKADGVFLWVVFTLREIIDAIGSGEDYRTFQNLIDDQSGDIVDRYTSIVNKIFIKPSTRTSHTWAYFAMFFSHLRIIKALMLELVPPSHCSTFPS